MKGDQLTLARKITTAAPAAAGGAKTVVRRRRRTVDHQAQAWILILAFLNHRKSEERSGTIAEMLIIVNWARSVHAKTAELLALKRRPRLDRAVSKEERAAHDVNVVFLEGILKRSYIIDVVGEGELVFIPITAPTSS